MFHKELNASSQIGVNLITLPRLLFTGEWILFLKQR